MASKTAIWLGDDVHKKLVDRKGALTYNQYIEKLLKEYYDL